MTRICPKCNREITSLRNIVTGSMEYYLSLDIHGDIYYEIIGFEPDPGINEYWCPECDKVLFTEEEGAITFLKGE